MVTGQAAVGFVAMASAMLLLLFFFLNHVFAIVLVSAAEGFNLPALLMRLCVCQLVVSRCTSTCSQSAKRLLF